MVHAYSPEEGKARSKFIYLHTCCHTRTDVFQSVCKSVCQLNIGGGTGFLHVVTGYTDRVKLWHLLAGIFKYIGNNFHGRSGRVDVSISNHKLLKDVVLYRSRK